MSVSKRQKDVDRLSSEFIKTFTTRKSTPLPKNANKICFSQAQAQLLLSNLDDIAQACLALIEAGVELRSDGAPLVPSTLVVALAQKCGARADESIEIMTGRTDVVGDWIAWSASPDEKDLREKIAAQKGLQAA